MSWTVTRQVQWPEGAPVVEVSQGGLDYSNPDALVEKYPGEFQTYDDPREAVETAIAICRAWRQDGKKRARVGHGATGGMTLPFDTCTFQEARAWAKKHYTELPKCDRCGELLPQKPWRHPGLDGERFCREYCAEERLREAFAQDDAA